MVNNYKSIRVPKEFYERIKAKKLRLQKVASAITGREVRVPYTRVLKLLSEQDLNLDEKEIKKRFARRW